MKNLTLLLELWIRDQIKIAYDNSTLPTIDQEIADQWRTRMMAFQDVLKKVTANETDLTEQLLNGA